MITLQQLDLKIPSTLSAINYNDITIHVKQYLPVEEKLELISWVINQSADDLKFYNVGKLQVFLTIGIVKYYTDINILDEELTNAASLYDLFISTDLYNEIIFVIPSSEIDWIKHVLDETVKSIYQYQNSIMGILDIVTTDYSNLNFDVEQLQKNISNPENLTLLKDVMTKLG